MPIDINTEMTSPAVNAHGAPLPHTSPHPDPAHALPRPRSSRLGWVVLVIIAVIVVAGIVWGILLRSADEHHLAQTTDANAALTVKVMHPSVTGSEAEIALPGNTQAFDDTPIYSRTSGYLKQFFVDIGQHVKQGQLMAIIETPEVDQQLQVAQADLKSSQADLSLAEVTAKRYQNLLTSDSVSKQETDVAVSGAAAKRASVEAAEANVRRLQQLQSFERIYAPFSGVVTARNTDIGDLINAGTGDAAPDAHKDLFRIAATGKLRVFVAVPEVYAPDIHDGDTAALTLDEYPGQQFFGRVARNSNAIDMASRTLNVEVDVDNPQNKLLPGAYVFVHFKLPQQQAKLSVPANALLFRSEGLRVAVVRDGHVHLQPITIAKDNGATLEVASGVKPEDQVILDPPDSLAEGQPVRVNPNGVAVR
ncbi:MAG TPA: efflux RND transporter periplasmic adaptor subunit [Acidobacteriaceae bacterium]|nr:efflux RND transporter periplasmic adaptor subunit [Acidobacteriaceae bacterium]